MRRAGLVERWLPGTLAVAGVLAAWELLGRSGALNPALLPAPSVVLATLVEVVREDALAQPIARTLALMATGYLIACACGIALGVAMGRSLYSGLIRPLFTRTSPLRKMR